VRFRTRSTLTAPTAAERWWNLGAIAVAERAEDTSFLLGHADRALSNTKADIRHLEHALARLPGEPRLLLAAGIALDWKTWPVARERGMSVENPRVRAAVEMFEQLLQHEDVGAEAALRLASLLIRAGDSTRGLDLLRKAEDQTRDKYLVYLARFFAAQVHQMEGRIPDAITTYREAARTLPGAQGASLALASLLALTDRGAEASELARAAQTLPILDPWRGFADGDDRFWPEIVARLRKEIRP
jgi:tetratricopeptide (TPR) repeat protein